jgi:Asp-tRNA(Asn)/Glu-tRNA(Gln) amidotransferase A subunit family amidase
VDAIAEGHLTARHWVEHCVARIDETDAVHAWSFIDRERALARADRLDRLRQDGSAFGPLHGVPVGIKDIIAVAGMPLGCGSELMGEVSDSNASLVDALEAAGAIILGKTETTEFATMHPAPTKNPHDLEYSPGGSSAGSAAAVAAGAVPLAVGSQTNGSVIRPASYCGVFGMKPSAGLIPRIGVLEQSPTLDQMGLFAASLEDLALGVDCINVHDSRDPQSIDVPRPQCLSGYYSDVPIEPCFAAFRLPFSDRQSTACTDGVREVTDALGGHIEILEAPPVFDQLIEAQRRIHHKEAFIAYDALGIVGREPLSNELKAMLQSGQSVSDSEYQEALEIKQSLEGFFHNFFEDFDAIVSPSAAGEAPLLTAGHTGDPVFCTIWTLAGLPCLNLPLMQGDNGLPMGVQLIGRANDDARLVRTANWLMKTLFSEGEN